MNYKVIFRILGYVLLVEAVLLLIPMLVAAIYRESLGCFIIAIAVAASAGGLLQLVPRDHKEIYVREGLVIVALSWLLLSVIGALPYMISGYIPSFTDAFFESVSGFTTTGATILKDFETLPHGLLFWRSFTQWIGGMGILVFVLAIIPLFGVRSVYLMRAEYPGPTKGKLVPKMQNSSVILYSIYIFLALLEVLLLALGGMPIYDAFIHALSTAGTGGFSNRALSVSYYNSVYLETVIGIFMLLFGINFNIFFFMLMRDFRSAYKSEELRSYLGIILAGIAIVTVNLIPYYNSVATSFRHAFFQVTAILTTTAFWSADFNLWPTASRFLLVLFMLIGASAGSTGGAIKVSRIVICAKAIKREIKRLLHPRSVNVIKLDDKPLAENVISSTCIYILMYVGIIVISTLLISLEGYPLETSLTSVIASISNIGIGLQNVSPASDFSFFSDASKFLLTLNMFAGRLEIFPVLALFLPSTWIRSKR